jgi:hypothetical protein
MLNIVYLLKLRIRLAADLVIFSTKLLHKINWQLTASFTASLGSFGGSFWLYLVFNLWQLTT